MGRAFAILFVLVYGEDHNRRGERRQESMVTRRKAERGSNRAFRVPPILISSTDAAFCLLPTSGQTGGPCLPMLLCKPHSECQNPSRLPFRTGVLRPRGIPGNHRSARETRSSTESTS